MSKPSPDAHAKAANAASENSLEPTSPGLDAWVARLLADEEMLRMGHAQRREDRNLGMGWIYYGLTRLIRPSRVVVIGSWRGFVPLIFGKALADNKEAGKVTFIDPSLVDDNWSDPEKAKERFGHFAVDNIEHHKMTTQQFVETEAYRSLDEVGIVFVDGMHTEEQARFDYEAFADRVPTSGVILLHDSLLMRESRIYRNHGPYRRTVKLFIDQLTQDPMLQVLDLPFCNGLTLVRRTEREAPN